MIDGKHDYADLSLIEILEKMMRQEECDLIDANIPKYSIFGDDSTAKLIVVVNSKAKRCPKRKRCEYKVFRAYKSANGHFIVRNS